MQSLMIENKMRQKLAAIQFMPACDTHALLIICHGFRGAKENGGKIYAFTERINQLGVGVIAFDFSGSGQSEGDFSSLTLTRQVQDLQAVIDYLDARYDLPIILLGRSFGGATVLAGGAFDERVKAFIVWSTPVFLEKTFSAMLPEEVRSLQSGQMVLIHDEAGDYYLDASFIRDFEHHDMDRYLRAIHSKPVLIIHAQDDEIVPAENAMHMHRLLEKSKLVLVEDAGHRFMEKIQYREDLTLDWLQEYLNHQDE